ncbi:non-specific lipid-transfer protein 1-like [Vicia villosa]|uniref:non-specific lipid-transfer protein 1-like n=1 Tax=Vicia villosa TaxID=3911 RepID=UPI00273C8479|nr:non-specific lipid-transfer protein 1-like [Vicia villosa]
MGNFKLACVVMMFITLLYVQNGAAVSCGQVTSSLVPCMGYVQNGGAVSPRCCYGIRGLVNGARTTADRRAACACLKSAAASLKRINVGYAAALPGKCGVNIPYKISASTNCASIR